MTWKELAAVVLFASLVAVIVELVYGAPRWASVYFSLTIVMMATIRKD